VRSLVIALLALGCQPEHEPPTAIEPKPIRTPVPEPKACEACLPERTLRNPEVDPECPCVWTKALSLVFTEYTGTATRVNNLNRAAGLIYGKVLQPGDVFSFNDTVGPRNEANGFGKAPVLYDGELMDDWGGGVCQVSSTLHLAALHSGLFPSQRHPHTRPSSYIDLGLDATVSFPAICEGQPESACFRMDFQFVNVYDFPVGLKVQVDDDAKRVWAGVYADKDWVLDVKVNTRFSYQDDFEVRKREKPRVKHEKLVQKGQRGRSARTLVTVSEPKTGVVRHYEYPSTYRAVPEVWDVPKEPLSTPEP
jgi:vancomycin resistance protein YoaR